MGIHKSIDSSSLAEVVDRILDKGIVIDVFVRASLAGIEILTVEARGSDSECGYVATICRGSWIIK